MRKTSSPNSDLTKLIASVQRSAKYRHLSESLIASIGQKELDNRKRLKEAIKSTKSKLHQIGGAYFDKTPNYTLWLDELRQAQQTSPDVLRETCRQIMGHHASTRERLACLDTFYSEVFASLGPICSVLDLACGLNPLAIPWMPLEEGASYHVLDIYADMLQFIGAFAELIGVCSVVECEDVLQHTPEGTFDLVLLLKSLPCLAQVNPIQATGLLDRLHAETILVSYPVASLGGTGKRMRTHYEEQLASLVRGKPWHVQRLDFATELAFLIRR